MLLSGSHYFQGTVTSRILRTPGGNVIEYYVFLWIVEKTTFANVFP